MTALNTLLADKLMRLDSKCFECFNGDTMLCSGIRLYTDGKHIGKQLNVFTATCPKLRDKLSKEAVNEVITSSGVPASFIADNPHGVWDDKWTKPFQYLTFTEPTRYAIWKHGLAMIEEGYRFKYVSMMILLNQYHGWGRILSDFGERYDMLVIDRFDMGSAPEFILDAIYELVMYRYNNKLQTIIVVGDNPKARNAKEKELYTFMENTK